MRTTSAIGSVSAPPIPASPWLARSATPSASWRRSWPPRPSPSQTRASSCSSARAFADVCASLPEPAGLAALATDNLDDALDEIAAFPRLALALRNTVGKGAVGGPLADLEAFAARARAEGWPLRVQLLRVQGPYHTAAFAACRDRLAAALERVEVRPPRVPVFMGTSGRAETDPVRIKTLLAAQPFSCERHLDAVRASYASGCRDYLEVAARPQPIHWLSDQLVDEAGAPLPGVTARSVTTDAL